MRKFRKGLNKEKGASMKQAMLAVVLTASLVGSVCAASANVFYVYSDKGQTNSTKFAPSGWMGDYGDIKFSDASTDNPVDGRTCVKVSYSAKGAQGANWAGIYWQHPPNNWGTRPNAGYDLSKFKKLTLWARGEHGGEKLAKFGAGGISGEFPDSDAVETEAIVLTKDWKKYTIDLAGKDFHSISGGFLWAASRDDNPEGLTMYLDEVRYEQ